ncbi:hypoxanthine phosphoribosyltransferase [Symbiobacterium terraclitae]|uniref:Hypoxanthine phosphoribosyltransferase n=1 Tax=Symbiobacterium terraclitae TaxID=557451 RepID=A0ABS4JQV7_9FIRM|nr:hypoxanthine phosphoribosyltransferase [Symbiobacterium terraclitae]MBP2017915.1 hypoxanthine phosphoribosyltransferase [Symbiobacterium terraclitae]
MARKLKGQLLSAEQIAARVRELGAEISRDLAGQTVLVVGVLKGAFVFCADLLRCLTVPAEVDFMAVSSYGSATESSGVIRILKDLDASVTGKHVLLVEDIVDSGLTLRYLKEYLEHQNPASLRVCVLLDKPARRQTQVAVDYVGFTIPDEFIVGYGIDYAEQYRHLPYIGIVGEDG